jgi:hypothetical protein
MEKDEKCSKKPELMQKVKVYRNIRNKMFSVLDYKTHRLITHMDTIVLKNVEFKVQKSGKERVRKTKQKYVHAYAVGNFYSEDFLLDTNRLTLVNYNPYINDSFITFDDNKSINNTKICYLTNGKCYINKN